MEYTGLKEKLEKVLQEDLSNRSSLQDVRRNLFLNSESGKAQQNLLSQKDGEISSLTSLVEKKKSILQQKDEEIASLKESLASLETKISALREEHTLEKEKLSAKLEDTSKFSALSVQNEEFLAKIRELIIYIDKQNGEIESLKQHTSNKSETENLAKQLEERTADNERLSTKVDLLISSEQQLKLLVSSQNAEIDLLSKANHSLVRRSEELAEGWQEQQEQLLKDNATLEGDYASLNEEFLELQLSLEKNTLVEKEAEQVKSEKEHLSAELIAVKHELEMISQQKDEKMLSLQSEISALNEQIISLQTDMSAELSEKQQLNFQLEELKSALSQKEETLSATSLKTDDEFFIDKLLSQVNLLNNQKLTFETLYGETESELNEARSTIENLSQLAEKQKNSLSHLEQTNKSIKLAQTLMLQVKDKTAAKLAINELVKEIDHCIALLSE